MFVVIYGSSGILLKYNVFKLYEINNFIWWCCCCICGGCYWSGWFECFFMIGIVRYRYEGGYLD